MCKISLITKTRLTVATFISSLIGLFTLLLPIGDALAQSCVCNDSGLTTSVALNPKFAHVGDTILVSQLGVGLLPNNCTVTNGQAFIMYPNGLTNIVAGPPTGNGLNGLQEYN